MTLLGGNYVRWHMYQSHIFPLLKIYFTPIKGEHGPLCILISYSSNSGAARICQRGPKQGSEVTKRGEGGFPPPTVGRLFENVCMKTKFLAH